MFASATQVHEVLLQLSLAGTYTVCAPFLVLFIICFFVSLAEVNCCPGV